MGMLESNKAMNGKRFVANLVVIAVAAAWAGAASAKNGINDQLQMSELNKHNAINDGRGYAADNWAYKGGSYYEQNFSALTQVNDRNVNRLGLSWALDLNGVDGVSATPIVIDGVIYVSLPGSIVYAVTANTGKVLWKFEPKVDASHGFSSSWIRRINRGIAVHDGKVYVGTADCKLIALNSKNGEITWSSSVCDPTKEHGIAGAPLVVKGRVYIGSGVSDFGAVGHLSAFDANNGKELWKFFTVPNAPDSHTKSKAMDIASKTWSEGYAKDGGAAVWGSIVYDPDFDTVYFGTDSASSINPEVRSPGGGDTLYTNSILAVDAKTGEYKWHYQAVPRDAWDYNANMPIMLADIDFDGVKKKVLMQAPKSGFFYVVDRSNGKLISADNFVPVSWASHYDLDTGRPVELPGARYYQNSDGKALVYPGVWGGHNWQPMSMSPVTGLVYFSAWNLSTLYATDNKAVLGGVLTDTYSSGTSPKDVKGRGSLIAWDPVQKMARWKIPQDLPINGGTLSTAGNLVFHGTATGLLNAYSAENGQLLWSKKTGSAIHAAPVSYNVDGKQVILAAVGAPAMARNSLPAYSVGENARGATRLMAFVLDGKARVPETKVREHDKVAPPNIPSTKEALKQGEELYIRGSCWLCHGPHADSIGGSIPSLTRSPILQSKEAWYEVVVKGAKQNNGMIGQGDFSPEDAELLRAYVADKARGQFNSKK